jgi:hypothetical protein
MEKDDHARSLAIRPSGAIAVTSQQNGILARMTSGVLAADRSKSAQDNGVRFRLGKYEFREPDYRQIELWAKALDMTVEAVLNGLENDRFQVIDGAIQSISWHFSIFPSCPNYWINGLKIKRLYFEALEYNPMFSRLNLEYHPVVSRSLQLNLPSLEILDCYWMGLQEIILSNMSMLKELILMENYLTKLDLCNVPKLEKLNCVLNRLTELNLSNVPMLKELSCESNQLTELNLSNLPMLETVGLGDNHLSELNLSNVPMLRKLYCLGNRLTKLDLSNVPILSKLDIDPSVHVIR